MATKPSGNAWLGSVPTDWEVTPLKFVADVFPSNVDKHSREGELTVSLCNYTDVYYNDVISADLDFMKATATTDQVAKFRLRAGDTIITKDSESADDIGLSAYVPTDLDGVVCGYHLSMIRPGDRLVGRYVKRLFDSHYVKAVLETSANGLTRVGLGQYALDNIDIPLPPLPVQDAIADFLDRETAKIDALIGKQEQLIATLREDRAATITQAVTKGLDPNVEMRDTGIGWLGEIPNSWQIMKLRHIGRPIIGLTYSPDDVTDKSGNATLVLRSANIQDGRLSLSDCVYVGCSVPPELTLQDGDVLLCSRNGSRALIGKNIRIDASVAGQSFGAFMTVFRSQYNEFLYWVFNSKLFDYQMATFLSSTINQLTTGNLKSMEVPLPSKDEQRTIAAFLDSHCAKIDTLIAKSIEMIETLREYRSALITDAVTGKIDVRGVA